MTTRDQAGLAGLATMLIRRGRRRARPLPLLCLRHGVDTASPLKDLASRMPGRDHRPRVPNAQPDLASSKADPEQGEGETDDRLPALLRAIIDGLTANEFGTDPLVFRHLELALAVMKIDLNDARNLHDRRREVARVLREQPGHKLVEGLAEQGKHLPGLPGLVYPVLSLLPKLVFWVRVSVLVPGLGRQFRWFVRQPFMTPTLSSGGFLGFATRLTVTPRTEKDRRQVHLLLMHAFLEDLRQAYRRRPWRLRGWRRTAHPVVLLDEAASDAGEPVDPGAELLRLINDVRNETGLLDPLVVVYAAHTLPPEALRPPPWTPPPAAEAVEQYKGWKKATQRRGWRLGPPNGWYLPLTVETPALDATSDATAGQEPITPGRPPWWSHRAVPVAVCLALVAGLTYWGVTEVTEHCGTVLSHGRVAVQRVQSGTGMGQCVGYSDDSSFVFGRDGDTSQGPVTAAQPLMDIQRTIFAQNREAEQRHRSYPNRPYVTLIYFGQLSGLGTFTAQSQQLQGIALRQRQALDAPQPAEPLLRVIVANAGARMQLADRTVAMLRPLILSDPTVVGVVGLDQTYRSTVAAIEALTTLGLPMIAPTLAADGLDRASPLYFQISAPTVRQAEVVTAYAINRGFRTARIIHAEAQDDLYVAALRSAVGNALTKAGLTVEPAIDWKSSPSAITDICQYPGMLFYAGRADDFVEFLGQFHNVCQSRRPANPIVAGGAVSRLIEDQTRRLSTDSTLPLVYVSGAHLVTCDPNRDPDPNYPTWRIFLDRARKAPWHACTPGSPLWLSERMELAYDATHAFLLAVQNLTPTDNRVGQPDPMRWNMAVPLTPGAVWHRLANLHYIDGVTGFIDFSAGRVPTKKWTALLRVNEIRDISTLPVMVYHCGRAIEADPPSKDDCVPGAR